MFGNVYWLLMLRIDLSVSENYKIKSWKQMYFVNYTSSFVLGFSNFLRAAIFRIYLIIIEKRKEMTISSLDSKQSVQRTVSNCNRETSFRATRLAYGLSLSKDPLRFKLATSSYFSRFLRNKRRTAQHFQSKGASGIHPPLCPIFSA